MIGLQNRRGRDSIVDWSAIAIYAAIVLLGWVNIYAAVHDDSQAGFFDFSLRYGQQMKWIGVSAVVALVIMLVDHKYYHMFAYPLYGLCLFVMFMLFLVGQTVKGATAWIHIGSSTLQPVEFMKVATCLALARYMCRYSFSVTNRRDLVISFLIIFVPAVMIVFQNDTGSAVVFGALLFPLYREGLNGWVYIAVFLAIALFVASFLLTPTAILVSLLFLCVLSEGLSNGYWRKKIMYLSGVTLLSLLLYFGSGFIFSSAVPIYYAILISVIISFVFVFIYAFRYRLRNVYIYVALFLGSIAFTSTVDYVFDNVLQLHQQKRILHLLGIESDTQTWGYNVDQSEIAIGSGGLFGKGFLEGTQTRFNFVPEQSTDFIFCTVGEEWGFIGSAVVVALFGLLILRLMKMGELQRDAFGRIYCYSAASIFFAHAIINIGMTIGLMPVIGIPLPFFSYGGSSFLAFTVLYFIAVKLDSGRRELMRH